MQAGIRRAGGEGPANAKVRLVRGKVRSRQQRAVDGGQGGKPEGYRVNERIALREQNRKRVSHTVFTQSVLPNKVASTMDNFDTER